MTTEELAQYYANLLIMQYVGLPKAYSTIVATVTPLIMDQMPVAVQNGFNLDAAVGVQLDILAKYVGASRYGYADNMPVTLNDSDFRQLLKMVIIKNNSGSSLATIQSLIAAAFPGQIFVSDNQAMGLNYLIVQTLGSPALLQILQTGGYLPKPMGVQLSVVVVPSITNPFFGFRSYDGPASVSPFNTYAFYQLTYPWLHY